MFKKFISVILFLLISISAFAYDFIFYTKDPSMTRDHYLAIQVINPTKSEIEFFEKLEFAFRDENSNFKKVHSTNWDKGPSDDGMVYFFYFDLIEK